ncbi:MAG: hypothetical protein J5507_01730 [Clostridia bacterium]|nr:hypothetical protein [Clostridia bacterium]
MNIAVINVKDLFKYSLKFFLAVFLILVLTKGTNSIIKAKQNVNIKETIELNTEKINQKSFTECLDLNISLMSYNKKNDKKNNLITNSKIISMGTSILDEKVLKNTDLIINENDLNLDDAQESTNKIAEIPKEVTVENVSENNIIPKVTDTYGTVKIDNQSDYEITENMLVPDVEITNKKDILIYHTHTCESYTPSERISI